MGEADIGTATVTVVTSLSPTEERLDHNLHLKLKRKSSSHYVIIQGMIGLKLVKYQNK